MNAVSQSEKSAIGELAGLVWHFLSTNGRSSVLDMKYSLTIRSSRLFMALGWLAREGKIEVEEENGVYYYRLSNK